MDQKVILMAMKHELLRRDTAMLVTTMELMKRELLEKYSQKS